MTKDIWKTELFYGDQRADFVFAGALTDLIRHIEQRYQDVYSLTVSRV